jgi:ABC-type antimicrobial peptide transport system permease subunit
MQQIMVSEQYLTYYEIKLIEGEMLNGQDDTVRVLINESAAKAFGWHKAVGKSFDGYENVKVKGVIRNIYNYAPTIPAKPAFYRIPLWIRMPEEYKGAIEPSILFKYNEGTWKTCKEKIEKILKEEYPDIPVMLFNLLSNTEEEYDKFLKSENVLLKLLMLISLVCVFICVFGFVSMVSLTCEERRKEIAIRKVSGATVKDILDIFFKEYLTLLAVGALIAFPAGYIIMKRWLEQYVVQTEISAWIYVAILLALILAIVLCVGGKVYKTSRENPVKAIKEN